MVDAEIFRLDAFASHMLDGWSADGPDVFPAAVREAYIDVFRDPAAVHAVCDEYRAAATRDRAHDEADRGRRRIGGPTLALWSAPGPLAAWHEPLALWRAWADDVRGRPVDAGHFLAEEAPEETARALLDFLGDHSRTGRPTAAGDAVLARGQPSGGVSARAAASRMRRRIRRVGVAAMATRRPR